MAPQRAILADTHGVTHWYLGNLLPRAGKNGRPACNFWRHESTFTISETYSTESTWPTCLLCATR